MFSKKGQGALELLLLIGGAVLVSVIAITIITSASEPAGQQTTGNSAEAICRTRGIGGPSSCTGQVTINKRVFECKIDPPGSGQCTASFGEEAGECGDGKLNPGEDCDGSEFNSATCLSVTQNEDPPRDGSIECFPPEAINGCNFDISDCTCGDGIKNGGDDCDGIDLGGENCYNLTRKDGELGCYPPGTLNTFCTFDTSGCNIDIVCGDGKIGSSEQCDDGEQPPDNGDGCSSTCQLEVNYFCQGEPSECGLEVDSCIPLSGSGTNIYFLTQDVSTPDAYSYCFSIASPGITLDCKGNTINGGSSDEGGIRVNSTASNSVVRNCDIIAEGSFNGIQVRGNSRENASNVKLENNTIHVNGTGKAIFLESYVTNALLIGNDVCGGTTDKSIVINNAGNPQGQSSGNTCAVDFCSHGNPNSGVCKNIVGDNGNNDCDLQCP
ncbi:MAG: class III signal peptide-containing protein [archaeon]|nr:class III signal peptide-containing protein [archaeon]